jgi:hypothetical protein
MTKNEAIKKALMSVEDGANACTTDMMVTTFLDVLAAEGFAVVDDALLPPDEGHS